MDSAIRALLVPTALLLAIAAPAQAQSVGDVLGRFADTGPTRETARAIATLCPAGNRLSARLQADCNNLVGAAFQNDAQVRNALAAITADNATVPIDRSGLGRMPVNSPMALSGLPAWALAARADDGLLALALDGGEGDSPWSAYLQARFDADERENSANEDGFARDNRTLDPYLRLESVDASSDGYAERPSNADANGGGWGVQVAELDESFTRTAIGLHSAWAISAASGVYVPYVDLSWVKVSGLDAEAARLRYTGDRSSTVGLSEVDFFMAADAEDDSYGSLGLGLSAQWADGWSGFVGYRHNVAEYRYDLRRVDLGLRMAF